MGQDMAPLCMYDLYCHGGRGGVDANGRLALRTYLSKPTLLALTLPPRYLVFHRWVEQRNERHMYIGLAAYRLSPNVSDWNVSEVTSQIESYRTNPDALGSIFFSSKYVTSPACYHMI
jgi:hypothetical protein